MRSGIGNGKKVSKGRHVREPVMDMPSEDERGKTGRQAALVLLVVLVAGAAALFGGHALGFWDMSGIELKMPAFAEEGQDPAPDDEEGAITRSSGKANEVGRSERPSETSTQREQAADKQASPAEPAADAVAPSEDGEAVQLPDDGSWEQYGNEEVYLPPTGARVDEDALDAWSWHEDASSGEWQGAAAEPEASVPHGNGAGQVDDVTALRSAGVMYDDDGTRYTWYGQNTLPGGGLDALNSNGRHVGEGGVVMDGDGFMAVASSDHPIGTVLETPFGQAKVYDTGCASGTIDVYTDWG